uniref:ferroxidase n=1 Tax=Callorhinchus milii TaxID=7868 RepID=V9K7L3_CALMI
MSLSSSLLLLVISAVTQGGLTAVRQHYIASVEIEWVYSGHQADRSSTTAKSYRKVIYKEYEDSSFTTEVDSPAWKGLLGPTLRAEIGDTLQVHFKNKASYPFNIRPQGVPYGKTAEGFFRENSLHFVDKKDPILPLEEYTYKWEITKDVAPTESDSQCLTYIYSSDVDNLKDFHSGLIGALLICKPGSLDEAGKQIHFKEEFVLLFSVFDESESWYYENKRKSEIKMYSINGFTNGTLPEFNVCAQTEISWHFIGMSSSEEIFSVHFNGQVLLHDNHMVSTIGLSPVSSVTALMCPKENGKWLLSSQVQQHRQAAMYGFLNVQQCTSPRSRSQCISRYVPSRKPGKIRKYFIAAEEIHWSYATEIPDFISSDFKSKYLVQGPNRIGKVYKKAIYVEYTDETFTERKVRSETENVVPILQDGIGSPVISAEIKDNVKIYFKNLASRPFSIYPHGVTVSKKNEGVIYPGNFTDFSKQVNPNQTFMYQWIISEDVGPTAEDPRCLTKLYHSAVDITRDIASGLFGPLLICKRQSLNARNFQIRTDEEQHLIFAAFDENKSWYIDDNIQQFCQDPSTVDPNDPEFYESNIMYTINGFVYESEEVFPLCEGTVTYWHVSSVGAQDRIQSVHFHGHSFKYRKTIQDVLHLYPQTGETLYMQMDNLGEWLLRTTSSQHKAYGMRLRFKVYICDDAEKALIYHVIRQDQETKKVIVEINEEESSEELDDVTREFLIQMGMKSFRAAPEDDPVLKDILQYMDDDTESMGHISEEQDLLIDDTVHSHADESGNKINDSLIVDNGNLTSTTKENIAQMFETPLNSNTNPKSIESLLNRNPRDVTAEETNTGFLGEREGMKLETTALPQDSEVKMPAEENASTLFSANDPRSEIKTVVRSFSDMNVSEPTQEYIKVDNFEATMECIIGDERRGKGDLDPEFSLDSQEDDHTEDLIIVEGEDIVEVNGTDQTQRAKNKKEDAMETGQASGSDLNDEMLLNVQNQASESDSASDLTHHSYSNLYYMGYATHKPVSDGTFNETNAESSANDSKAEHPHSASEPSDSVETYQNHNFSVDFKGKGMERAKSNGSDNSTSKEQVSTHSVKDIALNQTSYNIYDYYIHSSEESSEADNEDTEKVFIYLKKNVSGNIRYRFTATPLQPKRKHFRYQEEKKGIHVSKIKSLRRYIKGTPQNHPEKHPKTRGAERRQAVAKMMMRHRKNVKTHISPRGFGSIFGIKQRVPIPQHNQQKGLKTINLKQTYSQVYQDKNSDFIIVGIPKKKTGNSVDFDEFIADIDADIPESPENLNEEEASLELSNPYTDDRRTHSETDRDPEMIIEHYLRSSLGNVRHYFIAAEEIIWDYAESNVNNKMSSTEQRNTRYKKVIFRRYTDAFFTKLYDHGERDEHLGILGPVIRAEVNDIIKVMFKNLASRPYSIHAHGVSYEKSSEGMSYEDFSTDWFRWDDVVAPNTTYTYVWNVPPRSAPTKMDSDCKAWVYYSSVDFEKDINSGLIGPLVICREGTLNKITEIPNDVREFVMLFTTFDETKSWYLNDNKDRICQQPCQTSKMSPDFIQRNTFHAINGRIDGSLKGLIMSETDMVRWYLINMDSSDDVHSIRFHGQTFIEKKDKPHRLGVYNLYPGAFETVEMGPLKAGIWLVDCEAGKHYKAGMRAHFLVLSKECNKTLGMMSKIITDSQITASDHIEHWDPSLARLHSSYRYNAWSVRMFGFRKPWIQVDLQKPIVFTRIDIQGASSFTTQYYITAYYIMYSQDGKTWLFYNGNSRSYKQIFSGNSDANTVKSNLLNPPIIARYIRLYPTSFKITPTLRMELYGCNLDYCSEPLGMKDGRIKNDQITASTFKVKWWKYWYPSLARLNMEGSVNAWQPEAHNTNQWLQINFLKKKKITGIITQGVKYVLNFVFVKTYSLHYSDDGNKWLPFTDNSAVDEKIFVGNSDHDGLKQNYIGPPIVAQYIRIIPKSWNVGIALRIEILGCAVE